MVAVALCLGAPAAHAQASPVNYWIPGWPMGFSGAAGEGADSYGTFPSFDFRDLGNGSSYARYNFSNGFFVGSQRNSMSLSNFSQSALGGFGSVYSEGVQFGYNLAGVEFQAASNISLSLGVGVVQQTGRIDSEINSLPGASSFSVGNRRY